MASRDVLHGLDADSRRELEAAGTERAFDRGEFLCFEGDPTDYLYVIRSGLIRVDRTAADGRVALLELAGSGDFFGELGALERRPRSAAARVVIPLQALAVPVEVLHELFRTHPAVLFAVATAIADRLRELTDQFVESGEPAAVPRVAGRIVTLLERIDHREQGGSISLDMPISQQDLAEWAGLSREGTAKALRQLRGDGVLSTGRRRLDIHRVEELRRLAGLAR